MGTHLQSASQTAQGEELPGWGLSIHMDTGGDHLVLRVWREDTLRRRGKSKTTDFRVEDVEDLLARVQVVVRTFVARRLF